MSAETINDLDRIPGLGPVRRKALAEAGVHTLQELIALSLADLAAIRGVGAWQARKIMEHLRQRGLVSGDGDGGASSDSEGALGGAVGVIVVEEVLVVTEGAEDAGPTAERESPEEAEAPKRMKKKARKAAEAEATALAAATAAVAAVKAAEEEMAESREVSASEEDVVAQATADELQAQRERLPDTAIQLMEAIRQAAVLPQLTRQLTRLLITAGEFNSGRREISDDARARATAILDSVDQSLSRAIQKRAFRAADQKELADRVRKRRRELEALLSDD